MDARKITIEILSTTTSSEETESAAVTNTDSAPEVDKELSKTLKMLAHPIKSAEAKMLGKNVIVNQAYNNAKSLVTQAVKSSFTRELSLRENYLGENTFNMASEMYSKASGFASSTIAGAISGSALGPYGAVAGAAIAATTYIGTTAINERLRYANYYQQLNETNFQTEFSRKRSSLYDNSRGTEN